MRWSALQRPAAGYAGLVVAISIAGALIRFSFLGEPMRYDEAYTFDNYALHSFGFIASTYDLPNNHVLYSLLTHVVWRVAGNHLWTVRLPAFLAGAAIVPVSYLVGRELYDKQAAVWAAALTATVAPMIDYSVEGRGYALGVLLTLVVLWLGAGLLRREPAWRWWTAFVICSALAVYTVPTMAYGVATVALWMVGNALFRGSSRDLRFQSRLGVSLAAAAGLSAILYLPLLGQRGWTFDTPLRADWADLHHLAGAVWSNWNRASYHPLDWLLALGAGLSVLLHRRIARHPIPVALAALVVLGGVLAFTPIPPFVRNWLYLLPIYLITAGAGLAWLVGKGGRIVGRPQLANAVAAVVLATGLGIGILREGQRGAEQKPSADNNIVGFLRHRLVPGETVALDTYLGVPAAYYFLRYSYAPPMYAGRPSHARSAHVLVLMVGQPGPEAALNLLRQGGSVDVRGARATLVARLHYISAFDVRFSL